MFAKKIHHGITSRCHLLLCWAHERSELVSDRGCRYRHWPRAGAGADHGRGCAALACFIGARPARWLTRKGTGRAEIPEVLFVCTLYALG